MSNFFTSLKPLQLWVILLNFCSILIKIEYCVETCGHEKPTIIK